MKKTLLYAGVIALLGLLVWFLFFKESKGAKLFKYIPQNSTTVVLVDPMAIMEKGKLGNFQNSDIWKETLKNTKENDESAGQLLESIMKDPKSSGINFSSYFATYEVSEGFGRATNGFICAIDDEAKFSEFAKKLPFDGKTEHRNGFNYKIHEFATLLAWNGEVAFIITLPGGSFQDEKLDEIFLKRVPSINHDAAFRKFVKRGADIAVYKDYKKELEQVDKLSSGFISKLNIPTDFAMTYYVNFENGKVAGEVSAICRNKEDEAKLNSIIGDKGINSLELIASNQPIFFWNFKLDTKAVFKLINEGKDARKFLDEVAKSMGMTKEEFENVFSGQASVAFLGVRIDSVERQLGFSDSMIRVKEEIPMISTFIGINDQKAAEKMLQSIPQLIKTGNYYKMITPFFNICLVKADKGLLIFMDEAMAKVVADKKKLSDGKFGEITDMVTKYSSSAYLELDIKKVPAETYGFLKNAFADDAATLDSVLMRFNNFKVWSEGNGKGHFELNFKDDKKNSLVQFLEIAEYVMIKQQEKKVRQEEMMRQFEEQMRQQMEQQGGGDDIVPMEKEID